MTKTFTVVAAMTLYEKGLFRLHQPIADFLPGFKDPKVAETDGRGIVNVVPAKRPITFEHLFTMTSGIPYPGDGSYTARQMSEIYRKAHSSEKRGTPWNTARMIDELVHVPPLFPSWRPMDVRILPRCAGPPD